MSQPIYLKFEHKSKLSHLVDRVAHLYSQEMSQKNVKYRKNAQNILEWGFKDIIIYIQNFADVLVRL